MLRLFLEDKCITARLIGQENFRSGHTGKELRSLRVSFDTHDKSSEDKMEELVSLQRPFRITEQNGQEIGNFKLGDRASKYESGSPITTHSWKLDEIENLSIESLSLADLSIVPYRYKEELDGGFLTIQARVKLTEEEEARLHQLPHYFPVVRRGISEEPKEMRLGQVIWSRQQGEEFKFDLNLVDRGRDTPRIFRGLHQPWESHVQTLSIKTSETLSMLLSFLEERGVIAPSDRERLTTIQEETVRRRLNEFWRVPDVDEWEDW